MVEEYGLKSEPAFFKENQSNDISREIYERETNDNSNDEGNSNFDTYKKIGKPEFSLDFFISNAKKRFMAGSSMIEDNVEDESDSEEDVKKKKKARKDKKEETKEEEPEEDEGQPLREKEEANYIKEFCSSEFGIYEKGSYVRVDIKKIKKKYIDHFKVDVPLVLCTTNIQETSMGYLKIRFSKHLWHPKILKTNDPIILSIGWRKFQTTPVYCVEDKNHRLRMIKYTPKYTSCYAVCYGPLLPINVACVAIQNYNESVQHFRISGTGDLLEVNQNFEVNKKLKLIGEPSEIFKKTAFVKGMFNSNVIKYFDD